MLTDPDPTYSQLVAENADLRDQLAAVTAERDQLQRQLDDTETYNRSRARRMRRLGMFTD